MPKPTIAQAMQNMLQAQGPIGDLCQPYHKAVFDADICVLCEEVSGFVEKSYTSNPWTHMPNLAHHVIPLHSLNHPSDPSVVLSARMIHMTAHTRPDWTA